MNQQYQSVESTNFKTPEDMAAHFHKRSLSDDPKEAAIGRIMKGTFEALATKLKEEVERTDRSAACNGLANLVSNLVSKYSLDTDQENMAEVVSSMSMMIFAIQSTMIRGGERTLKDLAINQKLTADEQDEVVNSLQSNINAYHEYFKTGSVPEGFSS